jgi:hypothetical protein
MSSGEEKTTEEINLRIEPRLEVEEEEIVEAEEESIEVTRVEETKEENNEEDEDSEEENNEEDEDSMTSESSNGYKMIPTFDGKKDKFERFMLKFRAHASEKGFKVVQSAFFRHISSTGLHVDLVQ